MSLTDSLGGECAFVRAASASALAPATRFSRAYVSYNGSEWWCGHLAQALSRALEVTPCPMARPNQPGHRVDADVTQLVCAHDEGTAFYLGSLDQLFRGVADLAMPTGIWADYFETMSRTFLPTLKLFDVVFCTQLDSIRSLRRSGIGRVEWLPFAFDTTMHNDPGAAKKFDVGFVGNLDLPPTRAERVEILGRLENKYRLNNYRQPAFGDDMLRVYNQSRIVLNIPALGGLNMRTFEALASGALLLTKRVGNGQDSLFKEGRHLVTYRDHDDLTDKVNYYLRHERERQEMAAAGMREVLERHTYAHRAARVLEVMAQAPRMRSQEKLARLEAYATFYDYARRPDLVAALAFDRQMPTAMRVRLLARAGAKFARAALNFRKSGGV